jgi:GTPase SAR1 family protein
MTLQPQQLCIGARISGDLVMLASDERRRRLYIIGQTGTGKSTLLLNLIAQDLSAGEGLALPIVADGVVSAFRHVWPESWGPRLDYILTNAVRALLDVPGATLLMLPRLLIDEAFRVRLVEHHVGDPVVRAFWLNEYAGYGLMNPLIFDSKGEP